MLGKLCDLDFPQNRAQDRHELADERGLEGLQMQNAFNCAISYSHFCKTDPPLPQGDHRVAL